MRVRRPNRHGKRTMRIKQIKCDFCTLNLCENEKSCVSRAFFLCRKMVYCRGDILDADILKLEWTTCEQYLTNNFVLVRATFMPNFIHLQKPSCKTIVFFVLHKNEGKNAKSNCISSRAYVTEHILNDEHFTSENIKCAEKTGCIWNEIPKV